METLSLSDMQQRIKQVLEGALSGSYWITAEINELKTNSAGHCYLELVEKDEAGGTLKAKASATIWAYTFRMLKPYFETTTGRALGAGIRVLVKANVQFHAVYGLSLSITDIDPAYTVGEVELQRRKTIAQLQADGVFDMNRELELPLLPQRVAVISSEQAAGFRDFMNHLHHNEYDFAFHTQLFPSLMQGAGAVQGIIESLSLVNAHRNAFDAVVIIRGGGSVADLACFDDYELAAHVAQFPLPVLTGIGHDKDESVVDMVAHTAFKTPTAVADFLIDCFAGQESRLYDLGNALQQNVRYALQAATNKLVDITNRRNMAMRMCFQQANFRLQLLEKEIHHKNPYTILARGYAVVSHNGQAIRDAAEVKAGDELQVTLYSGRIAAEVKGQKHESAKMRTASSAKLKVKEEKTV